eukprot:6204747-Pleurochrysis_carterae.AAC.2
MMMNTSAIASRSANTSLTFNYDGDRDRDRLQEGPARGDQGQDQRHDYGVDVQDVGAVHLV